MKNQAIYPYPHKDESLHSYLFRTLKINGFNKYSSLLEPTTGWSENPFIPSETRHIISRTDYCMLLKAYEKTIKVNSDESDFINCFEHIKTFEENFYTSKKINPSKKGFYIKFCPYCMKNQIINFGYSYFRHCWNNQSHCKIHSIRLLAIKPNSRKILAKRIDDLLCFNIESDSVFIPSDEPHSKLTISDRSIKFSPCAKRELINWASKNERLYPNGYSDSADYKLLNRNERRSLNLFKKQNSIILNWDTLYQNLIETDYKNLILFITKNIEIKHTRHIINGLISKKAPTFKSNKIKCDICRQLLFEEYKHCQNNKLIFYTGVPHQLIKPSIVMKENICTKSLKELSYKVYLHQEMLGVRQGEIRLENELNITLAYKIHGGKDSYLTQIGNTLNSL